MAAAGGTLMRTVTEPPADLVSRRSRALPPLPQRPQQQAQCSDYS
jgi:hypothetical protein